MKVFYRKMSVNKLFNFHLNLRCRKMSLMEKICARMLVLTALWGGLSAYAFADLVASFETVKSIQDYGWLASGNAPAIGSSSKPSCRGQKAMEVFLDRNSSKVPYRTEATALRVDGSRFLKFGKSYWMRFSVFLPADWRADTTKFGDVVMQMQGTRDRSLGEGTLHPNVALMADGNQFKVEIKSDAKQVTKVNQYAIVRGMTLGNISPGKWTTFVVNFKVSYKSDGFFHIWQDGKKYAYNGPVFFNDLVGPSLRLGLYKPSWRPTATRESGINITKRLFYTDEVLVTGGGASYGALAIGCGAEVSNSPNTVEDIVIY